MKNCFNCDALVEARCSDACPNCGVVFEDQYQWDMHMQIICNTAVNFKREGKYNEANEIYKALDQNYPNNPVVYKAWAKSMTASGNYDKGLELFIKAKKLYEFYDSPEPNCDEAINVLMNAQRDPYRFFIFLKRISGNPEYKLTIK